MALAENNTKVEILNLSSGSCIEIETGTAQPMMQFSPDDSLLVTAGYGKSASLWRVADGTLLRELPISNGPSGLTATFSPNGRLLALGDRNDVTLIYEVDTGRLLHTLKKTCSHGLAFAPAGDRLAIGYVDGTIAFWDVASGELLKVLETGAEESYSVDWSPSGDLLASAGLNGSISLWSTTTYTELRRIEAPEWVISLKFSPDGTRLVSAGGTQATPADRAVKVWGVGHALTRLRE